MIDQRFTALAKSLINYSVELQKGEKLLIEVGPEMSELACELINEAYAVGGVPFVNTGDSRVLRRLLFDATEEQINILAERDEGLMNQMDAYISFRGNRNESEMADVPAKKMELYQKLYSERVHSRIRVEKTKWVVLRFPSPSMAQMAKTSTAAFEDFYFNVCNIDYSRMSKAMDPLAELMEKTDKVRILGQNTDLTFSIKGMKAIKCDGKRNVPDGEVYTAPVKNSVEGKITYNTPSRYQGFTYENISLEFKAGKIVNAVSNDTERINKVFDTDDGSRYIGEFALGVHPNITAPIGDILFDEKISGSIHFTPGTSYADADNGNKSAVHWDLVYIQTPDFGGGEIYFDDVLIRKDGLFVPEALTDLNPDNLK